MALRLDDECDLHTIGSAQNQVHSIHPDLIQDYPAILETRCGLHHFFGYAGSNARDSRSDTRSCRPSTNQRPSMEWHRRHLRRGTCHTTEILCHPEEYRNSFGKCRNADCMQHRLSLKAVSACRRLIRQQCTNLRSRRTSECRIGN